MPAPSSHTAEESAAQAEAFRKFKAEHPEWYYPESDQLTLSERLVRPYHLTRFYLKRVNEQFGWRFLVLLTSAYFGVKGFLYQLLMAGQLPYFVMFMQVSGAEYQIFGTVATTPYSMKALIGMISDCFPIRGFFKKYYLGALGVFGGICFMILGFVEFPKELAMVAAIMFFLGHFEVAAVDLLVEGRYAELMVKNPETSSDIVTWVWASYFVGGLIATWVVGPLGDHYEATGNPWFLKGMFLASAPLASQIAIPVLLNYLGEVPLPRAQWGFQAAKWRRHRKIFLLAILMGVGAVGLAVISLINTKFISKSLPPGLKYLPVAIYSVVLSGSLVTASFFVLPRGTAKALTYMFVTHALYIGLSGPLDIFYTAGPKCVPDGPHFSQSFYITWSGTLSSITGFVGVILFQAIMSEWEFRPCFWVTVVLQIIAGTVDIVLIKRWNVQIGLPDTVLYMVGFNIIYQIVYMMNFMPGVVLISKLCPKGMESTLYALLAGFSNFGNNIARSIGVFMIQGFGVSMVDAGPCDYSNLHWLVLVGHIVLPILSIPATFLLLPKARLTAPMFHDEFHAHFGSDDLDTEMPDNHVAEVQGTKGDGSKKELA